MPKRILSYRCITDFELQSKLLIIDQIKTIFFLSSSVKSFASQEKKELFYQKWCGDYLTHYCDYFFVYIDLESLEVYGYISGVIDTVESLEVLNIPGALIFKDLYHEFPAHLHINLHPDSRGMGLGSKMVKEYINTLKDHGATGLHLITSKDSDNTRFYDRLGFKISHERLMNSYGLYFMGMKI